MSNLKTLLVVIMGLLMAQPTQASRVGYYPWSKHVMAEADYVFDFTAFPLGMETGFSETIGDFTITYSTPDEQPAFKLVNGADIPATRSFPWLLSQAASSILDIRFSQQAYWVGVEYVILGEGSLTKTEIRNSRYEPYRWSFDFHGAIPSGLIYPEGFSDFQPLCVCANSIDAVVLSDTTDAGFGVRRIFVGVAQVPEPSTPVMVGIGLAAMITLSYWRSRNPKLFRPAVSGDRTLIV